MAPQRKEKAGAAPKGKGGRGGPAVSESPAGRQAVGPFNMKKLAAKAKFFTKPSRQLRSIPETEGRAAPPSGPFEIVTMKNHEQKVRLPLPLSFRPKKQVRGSV